MRAQTPVPNISFDVVLAGYSGDIATAVVMAESGEVFVTGRADAEALPPTAGAFTDSGAGVQVTKFNADGTVGFTAALRGSRGEALTLDAAGNVFVAGVDESSGSPRGFVARLSADGAQLQYRTELGPLAANYLYPETGAGPYPRLALAVDGMGQAYVAGAAGAGSAPGTPGVFDATLNGISDGFVSTLDSAGTVVRKTFLGGSNADSISGVVVDAQGNVTVAGTTSSADFPVTAGTYAQPNGGDSAFVTSFDADGGLRYSTFFGGNSRAHRIARGRTAGPAPSFGGVWITGVSQYTGYSYEPPFPTTPDAYADFTTEYRHARPQTFVTHLSDSGELLYSSSLASGTPPESEDGGENGSDRAMSIAVDDTLGRVNRVYVAGESNRHVNFYSSDDDGFVFKFDFGAGTFGHQWEGAIGGNADEATTDLSLNSRGDAAYLAFTTSFWTAYEYAFDRSPVTRVYGRDLSGPYDPEMGDWTMPVVVISKRLAPDTDGDGVANHLDNCATVANPDQADANGDGRGDACEVPDTDGDGRIDTLDNCPAVRNADQADQDGDDIGDTCDPDRDGDGVQNTADKCALVPDADQADADADGIGDACDPFSVPPPYSNQLSLVGTAAGPPITSAASVIAVNTATNVVYALTAQVYLRAINGATAQITADVRLPFAADSITADPATNRLFVTDVSSRSLRVLDGTTLTETTTVAMPTPGPAYAGPFAVAVNGTTRRLYAAAAGALVVFDADSLASREIIPTAAYARRVWVDEVHDRVHFGNDFGQVWVLDAASGRITTVEGTAEVTVLDVASGVDRLYWRSEDGVTATVKNLATGALSVAPTEYRYFGGLRVNAKARRVYAWGDPQLLFDGARYYAGPLDFYMLDLDGAVLGRFNVPGEGVTTLAVNPATGFVYAADYRGNIHVIRDDGAAPPKNTPVGGNVTVTVPDTAATVTFTSVTAPGETTVTLIADPAAMNLTLPGGFAISAGSAAYEITTSATISGPIEVCLVASDLSEADFATAVILHGVNGAWQVEATRRDAATRRLCAEVASLSPFAVGKVVDTAPPQIACATPAATWQTANVSVQCTASDGGAGLASAADGSFTLSTSIAAGQESANASTSSRQVCDRLGNCTTAGPLTGIRIDMRAPTIQLTAPTASRYLINQPLKANYACADGGSGIASCTAPVAAGATIATTTAGTRSFAVTASDTAGNTATATVDYTVGYGLKALFAQTTPYKVGQNIPLQVKLVDAAGANLSSTAIVVTIRRVVRAADGAVFPMNVVMPFDAKAKAYGGKVETKGMTAGTYTIELVAGADPFVHTVQVMLN